MAKSDRVNKSAITLMNDLRGLMNSGDATGAVSAALRAVSDKTLSVQDLYFDCLIPLLTGLGEEWQNHEMSVWREHVASAICRDIIGAMAPEVARLAAKPNGRTVVLACSPDEQHDIGLRMFADLYRLKGWTAYFLGADVPVLEIIASAQVTEADTVVLSAATHFDLINIDKVIDDISKALPLVKIRLTGPAYKDRQNGSRQAELLDPRSLLGKPNGTD